jgi:hypothetical protein
MQASCYSGGFPVVVHNTGMPYGATGCAGQAVDMYMNCFKQYADEGFTKSTYPFDSDTHIKPGRPGFRAYGYGTVYTGAQICYATTYMEFPAMRGNNKEHYIGSQMQGENCYGGWLQECMECAWFGMSTTVGATTPFQNVCTAGRSAHPATANGGNCYCSGPENGGKFLHMYYSLTEEITG